MKNNHIKSPLNYVGGKYKLLKDILPLFPTDIDTFIDLFGGGANVCINVKANTIIYNDTLTQVVELLEEIQSKDTSVSLTEIQSYIDKYQLSKTNKEGYLKLREEYNNGDKTPLKFYTLLCYAFNNQIRFNSNGKFNMPFGKARSSFNPTLKEKFKSFSQAIKNKNIKFTNNSFENFNIDELGTNDFIYCDPPYYNSVATYNENGGWTKENEEKLLELLDRANNKGIKFALSNNLKYNNPILDNWKGKYNVHYLNHNYSNCNYQKKDKSKDVEVLITNY